MLSSEFGAFFISNIVKVCSAIIARQESLPRCWLVSFAGAHVCPRESRNAMTTEKVTKPNENQSEPHPGSAGH